LSGYELLADMWLDVAALPVVTILVTISWRSLGILASERWA